jgi:hypothetical protein
MVLYDMQGSLQGFDKRKSKIMLIIYIIIRILRIRFVTNHNLTKMSLSKLKKNYVRFEIQFSAVCFDYLVVAVSIIVNI